MTQVEQRAREICVRFGLDPDELICKNLFSPNPPALIAAIKNWRLQEGKPTWTALVPTSETGETE